MIGSVVFGLASLVGLVFGSVSLATVVRAGSTLPANAIFSPGLCEQLPGRQWVSTDLFGSFLVRVACRPSPGQMFGLRPLVRDDVLGTLVTISGTDLTVAMA